MTNERVTVISIDELTLVRIVCVDSKCGVVTEYPVSQLDRVGDQCPHCRCHWGRSNPLTLLKNVLDKLQTFGTFRAEFVLKAPQ